MMTIRPLGPPKEWNRPVPTPPNGFTANRGTGGLAVSFQVHGSRISDLEVKDAWTGDTAMAMPLRRRRQVTASPRSPGT